MNGLLRERARGTAFDDRRFLQAWRLLETHGRVRPDANARFAMYRLRQLGDEAEAMPRLLAAAEADPALRPQIVDVLRREGREDLAARVEAGADAAR